MDLRLKNKLALVTGATHGIGKAIATILAQEGANIIICGRNTDRLIQTKGEISRLGTLIYSRRVDATSRKSIKELFDYHPKTFGYLDILINNVGGAEKFGQYSDLTDEDWEQAMNLNFHSMRHFVELAIPLLKQSSAGRIVNICSLPAHQPGFANPHYSAAKAAMLNYDKYLANVLGEYGILVNTVCPSTLLGGGWERNVKDRAQKDGISIEEASTKMLGEEKKKSPLDRIGRPEDVANIVAFLVSPLNQFITGTCINVDGGITRAIS